MFSGHHLVIETEMRFQLTILAFILSVPQSITLFAAEGAEADTRAEIVVGLSEHQTSQLREHLPINENVGSRLISIYDTPDRFFLKQGIILKLISLPDGSGKIIVEVPSVEWSKIGSYWVNLKSFDFITETLESETKGIARLTENLNRTSIKQMSFGTSEGEFLKNDGLVNKNFLQFINEFASLSQPVKSLKDVVRIGVVESKLWAKRTKDIRGTFLEFETLKFSDDEERTEISVRVVNTQKEEVKGKLKIYLNTLKLNTTAERESKSELLIEYFLKNKNTVYKAKPSKICGYFVSLLAWLKGK